MKYEMMKTNVCTYGKREKSSVKPLQDRWWFLSFGQDPIASIYSQMISILRSGAPLSHVVGYVIKKKIICRVGDISV